MFHALVPSPPFYVLLLRAHTSTWQAVTIAMIPTPHHTHHTRAKGESYNTGPLQYHTVCARHLSPTKRDSVTYSKTRDYSTTVYFPVTSNPSYVFFYPEWYQGILFTLPPTAESLPTTESLRLFPRTFFLPQTHTKTGVCPELWYTSSHVTQSAGTGKQLSPTRSNHQQRNVTKEKKKKKWRW